MTVEPTTTTTARDALDDARFDITSAQAALRAGDDLRQAQYARAAIDSAATTLLDPAATRREVVAARFFLGAGLALDGRANTCGADSIHTDEEASGLSPDDQAWLRTYLQTREQRTLHALSADDSMGL
ncbi:hypothetical protein [Mycolicibacterium llatzerense]|uniref:hypothetical protein n=1 Tax=Mycolicibacterium llatzerense TaxID=280871 RepID=UPI0021B53E36|nr:hypothetical protein [Mycolicibacterium llatzerense]MCT7367322.1 hypothetical protein [Mycolicibacterium llatzerense]